MSLSQVRALPSREYLEWAAYFRIKHGDKKDKKDVVQSPEAMMAEARRITGMHSG